jgi:ABC-type Mn2+/Zn2+ transport system permease subunit
MTSSDINKKIKQLNIEDFIWIIYIGIIFLSYYSNSLERNYYLTNNIKSKEKYRKILIIIFTILIFVYIYFLKDAYEDFKNLKETDSRKKQNLVTLSFIASLLIAISGAIFLYIAITDEDLNVELAFN